jgi:hypothetical protein
MADRLGAAYLAGMMSNYLPRDRTIDRTAFPQFLRRTQASQYLAAVWGLSYGATTLAKLCCLGKGPETHYWGRIAMHTPEALDAFARSRIRPTRQKRSVPQHEARP